MSLTENKPKKVEKVGMPVTSPQPVQTKDVNEYTQYIKFYPAGYRMHEDKEADNEAFKIKQANLRQFYGNYHNQEEATKAENFLLKAATNFRLLLQGWQATENLKTRGENSREFNEVSKKLIDVTVAFDMVDKYASSKDKDMLDIAISSLCQKKLINLMKACQDYIHKNDKFIIWSHVGRERFRIAKEIKLQAAIVQRNMGGDCKAAVEKYGTNITNDGLDFQDQTTVQKYKELKAYQGILHECYKSLEWDTHDVDTLLDKMVLGFISMWDAEMALKNGYMNIILDNASLCASTKYRLKNQETPLSQLCEAARTKIIRKVFGGVYEQIKKALGEKIIDGDNLEGIIGLNAQQYETKVAKFKTLYEICQKDEEVIDDDEIWPDDIPMAVEKVINGNENNKIADECMQLLAIQIPKTNTAQ